MPIKRTDIFVQAIACLALFFSLSTAAPLQAAPSQKEAGQPAAKAVPGQSEKSDELKPLASKVNQSLAAYKASSDPVAWDAFWNEFKFLIQETVKRQADLSQVLKSVSGVNEFGFRVSESGPVKVFSFTRAPDSRQILISWKDVVTTNAAAKKGRKPGPVKTVVVSQTTHFQALGCPSTVWVGEGRLLTAANAEPVAAGHPAARAPGGKYLVLCGADKKTGLAWLEAYRLAEGNWVLCPDLFSGVPPYLLQNVQGKPSFSGSNLVFASEPGKGSDSSGYRLVLKFFGDHFALDAKSSLDTAMTVALQFSQAIQKGRVDLVKAWLVDGKLASIPGYLGLYNRSATAPAFRVIAMAPPLNGGSRFRLITYDKNDLILDIGKIKAQWAVKGLFIAPADPLAKKLMGLSPAENQTFDQSPEQKLTKGQSHEN